MVSKAAERALAGPAELDEAVQKAAQALHGAPLATNALVHLRLKDGLGSYGALEDPEVATAEAIQPGEYNWLTVGVFQKGRYTFTVRGSSYARDDADYTDMLELLKRLSISRTTESEADGALLEAAYAGNLEGVTAALGQGAQINATDSRGWTPLIYAAKLGHARTALYLLEHDGVAAGQRGEAGADQRSGQYRVVGRGEARPTGGPGLAAPAPGQRQCPRALRAHRPHLRCLQWPARELEAFAGRRGGPLSHGDRFQ
jgi:hypothetical protein